MRKIFIGMIAALAVIFLGAAPAFAAAGTWEPTLQGKEGSYYLEDSIPQDARNTIESALELAEVPSDSSRHLYVGKLPEGANVQTAAREVAKAWELRKGEESLVFYDVTSGGTFIWPATEDNVSLAASIGGSSSVDKFSTEVPSLFEKADAQDSHPEIGEARSKYFTNLSWIILIFMGIPLIFLVGYMVIAHS